MKAGIAFLSLAAGVCAQGVTSAIAPKASAPAGCSASFSGDFQVTVAVVKSKRDEPVCISCPLSIFFLITNKNSANA